MPRIRDAAIVIGLLLIASCTPPTDDDEPATVIAARPSNSASATSEPVPTTERTQVTPQSRSGQLVTRVIDGDTFELEGGERVRLTGINAPEAGECYAVRATQRLKELVEARTVVLEAQVEDRDDFGRLLRDVFIDGVFINEALVREGFAIAVSFPPNTEHEAELEAAEEDARRKGAGLWSSCQELVQCLSFSELQFNAPGNDNENLNGEWVRITSTCEHEEDFTGWVLRDESATHRFRFPTGFALAPSESVTVFTGCGTNTDVALYWCNQGSAIWNNDGDTATLLNAEGKVVTSRSY